MGKKRGDININQSSTLQQYDIYGSATSVMRGSLREGIHVIPVAMVT